MLCPKCKTVTLTKGTVSGKELELDRCPECKGLWFDDGELGHVLGDKATRYFTVPAYAAMSHSRSCPRCNHPLYEFCYPGTMTLVDACKHCKGIWLDNNEWAQIAAARDIKNTITCPKCHKRQSKADSCIHCGIVFAKYGAIHDQPGKKKNIAGNSYAEDIPGIKGDLLRFIDSAIDYLTTY